MLQLQLSSGKYFLAPISGIIAVSVIFFPIFKKFISYGVYCGIANFHFAFSFYQVVSIAKNFIVFIEMFMCTVFMDS